MAPRLAQGQAGVYTVAAQLLLRGINPCFPAVDCGADIITDWGTRIQVKCSHRKASIWGGSYHFMLSTLTTMCTSWNDYKKGVLPGRGPRVFSNECDFFVFWGITDNRFWIIPSLILDGRKAAVMVGPDTPWLHLDQDAVLADHKAGMTTRAIAAKHSICQKTVLRVIHGNIIRTDVDTEFNKTLLKHENRWDLLLAEEQLLSEGEANLEVSAIAEEV
jgi:hypothetical protein